MTMNSSGPISLTGSTPGVSIQYQLGTTGPIALTDANVRALAGKPTGDVIMPTDFYGKGTPFYQPGLKIIKTGVPSTYGVALGNIVFSPSGKIIGLWQYNVNTLSGSIYIVPANTATVFQSLTFNANGTIYASSAFNNTAISSLQKFDLDNQSRVDAAGNVYFLLVSGSTTFTGGAVKYTSSGTFVNFNNYVGGPSSNAFPLSMSVVPSSLGDIYYAGYDTVFKTNSLGSIVWQQKTNQFMVNFATRVVANPLNNGVYLVMFTFSPTFAYYVLSFDSNGNLLGQITISDSSSTTVPNNLYATVDSLGNLYIYSRNVGQAYFMVSKVNSALSLVWTKKITLAAAQKGQIANCIAINEGKNKLFFSYTIQTLDTATAPAKIGVICFDLDGNYLYGRQIESTVMMGAVSFSWDTCIASYGDVYTLSSSTYITQVPTVTAGLCTFPVDGSKLGTYVTYGDRTYGTISTTYSELNPTISDSPLVVGASSLPVSTSTTYVQTAYKVNPAAVGLNVVANVNI